MNYIFILVLIIVFLSLTCKIHCLANPSSPHFSLALGDIRRITDAEPDAYARYDEIYEKVDKNCEANVY